MITKYFDAVVLGGGVIGVSTAYWLAKAGKSVCVVERQPDAGLETSFANGGQISVSHAEPWANPSAPLKVLKWLMDDKAPLLFRPRMDVHQWLWIARFLRECAPTRCDRNTTKIVQLATESRTLLQQIRSKEEIDYDCQTRGILHFYRDEREFEDAIRVAELMRKHGCERVPVDRDEVVRIEPAFEGIDIVGATYTAEDESGDAKKFTQGLAKVASKMGVKFFYGSEATNMSPNDNLGIIKEVEVRTPDGYMRIRAGDVVVSLGCHSAPFLRPYGVRLPIYPSKGYSITIPLRPDDKAPKVSLTDDENKIVYSNLGDRLRVAGTAELSGYSNHLNYKRCDAIRDHAQALFPGVGDYNKVSYWTGLRPTTPSNLPYLGRTRKFANLWTNTGHGTLGWTMAAGSGARVANMISGDLLIDIID